LENTVRQLESREKHQEDDNGEKHQSKAPMEKVESDKKNHWNIGNIGNGRRGFPRKELLGKI
jgi:hypothetical protein